MAETSTQIVREAPEVEKIRMGLVKSAQALKAPTLPKFQTAGFSQAQIDALRGGAAGIGAYQPYMSAAKSAYGQYGSMLGQADDYYTRGLAQGTQGLNTAANMFGLYDQADIGAAQRYMTQSLSDMSGAGPQYNQAIGAMRDAYAGTNLSGAQQALNRSVSQMQGAGPQYGSATGGLNASTLAAQRAYAGTDLAAAQRAMNQSLTQMQGTGPNFNQSREAALSGMSQAEQAAQQAGFQTAEGALGRGISSLRTVAQEFDPTSAERYMNPYQQQVIDESLRQINRQGLQAQQQLQAQAVRTGAFGGSREGIQRAELGRGLAEAQNASIVGALSSGYQSALQQAQQAFESQKQRQLAQSQGYQSAAGMAGNLASQQGQLGLSAAQMAMQGSQQLGSLEAQRSQMAQNIARYGGDIAQQIAQQNLARGQLGLSTAQLGAQNAAQLGALETQRSQFAQNAARYGGDVAQQIAQQNLARGQLGMQYGQQLGSLETQRSQFAQNAARYRGDIGQQLANQQFQQANLGQAAAGQLANIAGQRFSMGTQTGAGIASLASQYGTLGGMQSALGQQMQNMGQQDVNFLFNLGLLQQQQKQRELDALRNTQLQEAYSPYQQLAFTSDIYKGAPSSQMSFATNMQPTPSAFQQATGALVGGVSTAAAAKSAGIL